jgi:hypothetical protein
MAKGIARGHGGLTDAVSARPPLVLADRAPANSATLVDHARLSRAIGCAPRRRARRSKSSTSLPAIHGLPAARVTPEIFMQVADVLAAVDC